MREYSKVSPAFWTGDTGRKLKNLGPHCQILALYLITCHHATMLGLYYLPAAYISADTGISPEGAMEALGRLSEVGFCFYDAPSEWVFIAEMARFQVLQDGEPLDPKDNRIKGINKEYRNMPNNPFLFNFYGRYQKLFHLKECRGESPYGAPSKPLPSQEQEQEQEKAQEQKIKPLSAVADVALEIILKNEALFHITKADVSDWVKLFPSVDVIEVLAQIQKTCTTTPAKRKDEEGIREHIVGCLKMMQDRKETFERIWNRYPSKDGKKEAERHFRATVQTGDDLKDIHTALDKYLDMLQKNPTRPPKNGSTWFNNWKDWVNWEEPAYGKGTTGGSERKPAETAGTRAAAQGIATGAGHGAAAGFRDKSDEWT